MLESIKVFLIDSEEERIIYGLCDFLLEALEIRDNVRLISEINCSVKERLFLTVTVQR